MSKIMDLYAEVNDIDDLKPVYRKDFFDKVQKDDEERAIRQMLDKAKTQSRQEVEDWLYARAEWDWGIDDDDGHAKLYFENFVEVCEEAATDLMDAYIEEEHFDVSDEQYYHMIEVVKENLEDMWADIEEDCIKRCIDDAEEESAQMQSYYNAVYDRGLHE